MLDVSRLPYFRNFVLLIRRHERLSKPMSLPLNLSIPIPKLKLTSPSHPRSPSAATVQPSPSLSSPASSTPISAPKRSASCTPPSRNNSTRANPSGSTNIGIRLPWSGIRFMLFRRLSLPRRISRWLIGGRVRVWRRRIGRLGGCLWSGF